MPQGTESFLLAAFVFTLFLIFSITQIKQGKEEMKTSSRPKWLSKLKIIFAMIILSWFIFLSIFLIGSFINFLIKN